jgi:hypothetical protein
MNKAAFETYLSSNKLPVSFLNFSDVRADLQKLSRIKIPKK